MNGLFWKSLLLAGLLGTATLSHSAEPADDATPAPRTALVSVDDDMGVTISTGNEAIDESANLLMRCTERKAALDACGGGFRGVACRKALEIGRYKNLDCPEM